MSNLIDRYLVEVGRLLPEAQRDDVQLELRSALQDGLEARGLEADKKSDQAGVADLLREFGPPIEMAKGYGLRTFLIGPELQPMYRLVLRINAIAATVVQLIRFVQTANAETVVSAAFGGAVGGFINQLLFSFAIVTIVFGLLDYFLPDVKSQMKMKDWDPNSLPEITPDSDGPRWFEVVAEAVVEMVFGVALIGVAATLPNWTLPAPLAAFAAPLLPFLPWIVALASARLVVRVFLLLRGRWADWLRWADLAIALGWVLLVGALFRLHPFGDAPGMSSAFQISAGVAFAVILIEFAGKLYRLTRPRR